MPSPDRRCKMNPSPPNKPEVKFRVNATSIFVPYAAAPLPHVSDALQKIDAGLPKLEKAGNHGDRTEKQRWCNDQKHKQASMQPNGQRRKILLCALSLHPVKAGEQQQGEKVAQ